MMPLCRNLFRIAVTAVAGIGLFPCFRTGWFFGNCFRITVLMVIGVFFPAVCTLSVFKMVSLRRDLLCITVTTVAGIGFLTFFCTGWLFCNCFRIAMLMARVFFTAICTFTILIMMSLCRNLFYVAVTTVAGIGFFSFFCTGRPNAEATSITA